MRSFLEVQEEYDQLLRAQGFRDIESGGDLNRLPASSVAAVDASDGSPEFWRAVSVAVASLPRNYPRRAFLVTVAETGNVYGTCKKFGITHMTGRWALRKLLIRAGLERSRMARLWAPQS